MITKIILLGALIAGSLTDLKKREVSDILNYSLIIIALLIASVTSIIYLTFEPLISTLIGMTIATIFGMALFYIGQWGGGDAKLVMGIGGIIGVSYNQLLLLNEFYLFLIYSFLIAAITGIVWMIVESIRNKKEFMKHYIKHKNKKQDKYFKISYVALIFLTILLIYLNPVPQTNPLIIVLLFMIGFSYYLSLFVKACEDAIFTKKLAVNKLTEGDWVISNHGFELENTGITREQINFLKKQNVKSVTVKEGIPFVPSFLIAYILILIY